MTTKNHFPMPEPTPVEKAAAAIVELSASLPDECDLKEHIPALIVMGRQLEAALDPSAPEFKVVNMLVRNLDTSMSRLDYESAGRSGRCLMDQAQGFLGWIAYSDAVYAAMLKASRDASERVDELFNDACSSGEISDEVCDIADGLASTLEQSVKWLRLTTMRAFPSYQFPRFHWGVEDRLSHKAQNIRRLIDIIHEGDFPEDDLDDLVDELIDAL